MTQAIREKLAATPIGGTTSFAGVGREEEFNQVDLPFLRGLDSQGDISIKYEHRENHTGRRFIDLVAVERLR